MVLDLDVTIQRFQKKAVRFRALVKDGIDGIAACQIGFVQPVPEPMPATGCCPKVLTRLALTPEEHPEVVAEEINRLVEKAR